MGKFCAVCGGKVGETCGCGGETPVLAPPMQSQMRPGTPGASSASYAPAQSQPQPPPMYPQMSANGVGSVGPMGSGMPFPMVLPNMPVPPLAPAPNMPAPSDGADGNPQALQCYICGLACVNKTVLGMHINECYRSQGEGRVQHPMDVVMEGYTLFMNHKQPQAQPQAQPGVGFGGVPNGAGLVAARMLGGGGAPGYPPPAQAQAMALANYGPAPMGYPGAHGHGHPWMNMNMGVMGPGGMNMNYPGFPPGYHPPYQGMPPGAPGGFYPPPAVHGGGGGAGSKDLNGEVERLTRELESLRQGKEQEYAQKRLRNEKETELEAERQRLRAMQEDMRREMEALKHQQRAAANANDAEKRALERQIEVLSGAMQQQQAAVQRAQQQHPHPPPPPPAVRDGGGGGAGGGSPQRGYEATAPPNSGGGAPQTTPVKRFSERSARPITPGRTGVPPTSPPPPPPPPETAQAVHHPRRPSSGAVKGVQNLKDLLQGGGGSGGPAGIATPTGPSEGRELPCGKKVECLRCGREFGKKAFVVHSQSCGLDLRDRMTEKEREEYDKQHDPNTEENKESNKQQAVKKRLEEEQAWCQFMMTYPRNVLQETPLTTAERSNLKTGQDKPSDGVECSKCKNAFPLSELDRHEAQCQGRAGGGGGGGAPPPSAVALLPCAVCGRTFNPESLDRHEAICRKQNAGGKGGGKGGRGRQQF